MTRKKWNRLRRQRPELFRDFAGGYGWEKLCPEAKRMSKGRVIAILTAVKLSPDGQVFGSPHRQFGNYLFSHSRFSGTWKWVEPMQTDVDPAVQELLNRHYDTKEVE